MTDGTGEKPDTNDDFNPPGAVARDRLTSSFEEQGGFGRPGPVERDYIIKHGVPEDDDRPKK